MAKYESESDYWENFHIHEYRKRTYCVPAATAEQAMEMYTEGSQQVELIKDDLEAEVENN
jgi:hypothetical protein